MDLESLEETSEKIGPCLVLVGYPDSQLRNEIVRLVCCIGPMTPEDIGMVRIKVSSRINIYFLNLVTSKKYNKLILGDSPNRLSNLKKEASPTSTVNTTRKEGRSRDNSSSRTKSREGSPRMPRPRSEEIPLELIKKAPSSLIDMAPKIRILPRPQTPRVEIESCTSNLAGLVHLSVSDLEQPKEEAIIQTLTISEETSFIGDREDNRPIDRVETV